jgi:formate dehydrogenase major subunit
MATVSVTIDGRASECSAGTTILTAAGRLGIVIPTLCDDPRLEPSGACRLCLVEVAGWQKPVAACATLVTDGMEVRTASDLLESERRFILDMLAADYPGRAVDDAPSKDFHRYLRAAGIAARGESPPPDTVDDSHPYLRADMSRCIDCYRCVRICQDLQGQDVWHLWDRGADTVVHPDGPSLAASSCVACGACVDTCPTGALEDRSVLRHGMATSWTRTVCPYCGVGCELDYGTREGRIVASRPVIEGRANRGHACVKGRYAFDFVTAPDRIVTPRVRDQGVWRDTTWSDAIARTADGLRRIIADHGPDAVGVLGSARATNEDTYLIQKFARVAVGTNNVDCCARVCHAPSAAALKAMLGTGAATNSFDDIDEARTILIAGANPTENHPVVGARIRQAARRGAQLIVIDPRHTELTYEARAVHLAPAPGTNIPLLNALAHVIVAEGLHDRVFVQDRVNGFAEYQSFIAHWTPEHASGICGVPADEIRRAARLYAAGPSMIVNGLGITEHRQGTDGVCGLVNLALLTGNIGRPGAGVNPLRGQNNVQGAALMGCDPTILTGGIGVDAGRVAFEAAWRAPLPQTNGLKVLDMMDAALDGRLKALVVQGYDILLSNPNADRTRQALERLDLLVVIDLFWTATADVAQVFLPAQSTFEKDGTFMNGERRIQRVRRVVAPRGVARTDSDIVGDLASALGQEHGFSFPDAEAVWNEIRDVWPDVRGITYARLDDGGLQFPCPSETHPGTATLYEAGFPGGGRASLRRLEFNALSEAMDGEYPFVLTSGRTLYQFNAGTMTSRTDNQQLRPADTLDIGPADAQRLGLATGDRVRLVSRHGHTVMPVRISDIVPDGVLFATFHTLEAFLNRVTSNERDPVGTPEYKVTAVRVERLKS